MQYVPIKKKMTVGKDKSLDRDLLPSKMSQLESWQDKEI